MAFDEKKWRREWRAKNKQHFHEYWKVYYDKHGDRLRAEARERRKRQRTREREIVFGKYGGKCVCCGEGNWKFLTIDHKNGDGSGERKKHGVAGQYNRIIKAGFPKTYQILCYNCNIAKGIHSKCPHKE